MSDLHPYGARTVSLFTKDTSAEVNQAPSRILQETLFIIRLLMAKLDNNICQSGSLHWWILCEDNGVLRDTLEAQKQNIPPKTICI